MNKTIYQRFLGETAQNRLQASCPHLLMRKHDEEDLVGYYPEGQVLEFASAEVVSHCPGCGLQHAYGSFLLHKGFKWHADCAAKANLDQFGPVEMVPRG